MRAPTLLLLLLVVGCPGPAAPPCLGQSEDINGTCVINGSEDERAYVELVTSLLGGFYPVDVHLSPDIDAIHTLYVESFVPDPETFDLCVSGFSFEGSVWAIPRALAHELVHLEVEERTGLVQRNEITQWSPDLLERSMDDHKAQGWTEQDFLRVRWANTYSDRLMPYEITGGCQP